MMRTAERAVDNLIATELRIQDNRMPSHPSKRKLKDRKAEAAQWPQMLLSYTLQPNLQPLFHKTMEPYRGIVKN